MLYDSQFFPFSHDVNTNAINTAAIKTILFIIIFFYFLIIYYSWDLFTTATYPIIGISTFMYFLYVKIQDPHTLPSYIYIFKYSEGKPIRHAMNLQSDLTYIYMFIYKLLILFHNIFDDASINIYFNMNKILCKKFYVIINIIFFVFYAK